VVADPFALALISPPLALSTKTGSFLAPLTPLPHQKCQLRAKGNEIASMNLEVSIRISECSGSLFIVQVHFPFQCAFETTSSILKQQVSLKGSSCSTSPPKYVHHLHMDL
jgi:hypothetical protein